MDTNININFLDTECRLEGYRINWDHIKGLLETKNLSKRDVANDDLEALCYLKKKRFWLNLEFQKIELSFFYIKDNPSMDVLSTIRGAKEWIMKSLSTQRLCWIAYPYLRSKNISFAGRRLILMIRTQR